MGFFSRPKGLPKWFFPAEEISRQVFEVIDANIDIFLPAAFEGLSRTVAIVDDEERKPDDYGESPYTQRLLRLNESATALEFLAGGLHARNPRESSRSLTQVCRFGWRVAEDLADIHAAVCDAQNLSPKVVYDRAPAFTKFALDAFERNTLLFPQNFVRQLNGGLVIDTKHFGPSSGTELLGMYESAFGMERIVLYYRSFADDFAEAPEEIGVEVLLTLCHEFEHFLNHRLYGHDPMGDREDPI